MRVLLIAPEMAGLPKLRWVDELVAVAELEGVELVVCGGEAHGARRWPRGWARRGMWCCGAGTAPGRLMAADGPVGADWPACMRQVPPGEWCCCPRAGRPR